MPNLSLSKKDLPFVLGGASSVTIDTANLELNKTIPETGPVFTVGFKAGASPSVPLGQEHTVKVAISTSASLNLTPVFSGSTGAPAKLLKTYGVADFFKGGANADRVILALEAGAAADAKITGAFAYSALKATVTVDTGADGGYAYLRAMDKALPVQEILPAFFKTLRLPEQGGRLLEPGEAISLRYGGYLNLAAEISAGYKLAGTKSISLGEMALSEKYDLSILGKVGLSAGVAGRFSILVTAASDLPSGWTRVQARRLRSKDLKVAADVTVGFKNQLDGLPSNADEFLGAALGVNAKNFLNVFNKAHELSDFEKFKAAIDGLAQTYVGEFTGKAFDKLASKVEFDKFLARVNNVVTSYEKLEDRAITLFDRYFDKLPELTDFLDKIKGLTSLEGLRKDLNPQLFNMLSQLTDGDPLGFLLGKVTIGGKQVASLPILQDRAQAVLDLIRDSAHDEIRRVVALAKQSFGIDKLFRDLAKIDTPDELRQVASDKAGLFVSRLVGRALDSSSNVKEAFKEVRAVLDKIDGFKDKLFTAFREAVNSSYQLALHAEYSRASETDVLVDIAINLNDARGADLLAQVGKGDFEQALTTADTDLVRLNEGVLTHRTRRESAFNVNIVGWHLNYRYSGFDRVITEAEQRLIPSDQGITVVTTATLNVERLRKRNNEEMHVNFLLRALGESANVVKSDGKSLAYLIDSLKSLTAKYELAFTDDDTTELELRDYLAFAKDLGFDKQGATLDALSAFLPRAANGGFGRVVTKYDVRFGQKALDALLAVKELSAEGEAAIRDAMRQIVLSNYLKSDELHDVAFSYATAANYESFDTLGFATFIGGDSSRVFPVKLTNPGILAPTAVTLDKFERNILVTLYNIENSMVDSIKDLYKLLGSGKKIDPRDFEKKLGKFGDALKDFDKFDQTSNKGGIGCSTIFIVFDKLVRLASGGDPSSSAALELSSDIADKRVEKLFLTEEAATAGIPAASAKAAGAAAGG